MRLVAGRKVVGDQYQGKVLCWLRRKVQARGIKSENFFVKDAMANEVDSGTELDSPNEDEEEKEEGEKKDD